VLAVNKPAGLPTLPGANFLNNTLLHLVRTLHPDAAPLHRLGRWTSGLVLFAVGKEVRHDLLRQWSGQQVGKRYRALASGIPESDEMTITVPIGPVPHRFLGSIHAASPLGKPSCSRVKVLELREGSFLCDVRISTGRPHQIRIHLAAAGHPLEGDPLYPAGGVPLPGSCVLPGSPGYHLHSAELRFLHPVTGIETVIESEPNDPLLQLSNT
jgi:23S rRNA pseudouridine1911/1915/1917 synthase